MKFTGALASFDLDLDKYKRLVHEQLSEEIAFAAAVWMEAVLAEIPVWSGASWATFIRLSREIGSTLAINPKVVSRIPYGQRHGDGELIADPKKMEYLFEYSTTLKHLVHNEYNAPGSDPAVFHRLLKPGPYGFQAIGIKAFEKVAQDVRLPSPWKTLVVTKHRI